MRFFTLLLFFFLITPIQQTPLNAIIVPIDTSFHAKKLENTAFLLKKQEVDKVKKRKRIFRIGLIAVGSILLIYFLQGTLWLAIVPTAIFSFLKIRAIFRSRPPTEYTEYADSDIEHYKNSYARRSVKRFVSGLLFSLLSIVVVLLSIAQDSVALGILFFGSYLTSLIFMLAALFAAIKSFKRKEPYKSTATLILVLSILFLMPILSSIILPILGV